MPSGPHTPYPIAVNVWHQRPYGTLPAVPVGAPDLSGVPAYLQQQRAVFCYGATLLTPPIGRYLYTAAGTDIRLDVTFTNADIIECPAGSATYYQVIDVQDTERGITPNGERRVYMTPCSFPFPIP